MSCFHPVTEAPDREVAALSPEERVRARHALGLGGRWRVSRRNHVVCLEHDDWERLVRDGLATVRRSTEPGGLATYRLTRAGAEAALDQGESLDPQAFPPA